VNSSVVSCFDPVPVEVFAGFGLLRIVELAQVLGPAVGKPIGVGELIALLPFGALARGPQVDQFSHSALYGIQVL
jgi:hypothetical protein